MAVDGESLADGEYGSTQAEVVCKAALSLSKEWCLGCLFLELFTSVVSEAGRQSRWTGRGAAVEWSRHCAVC